MFGNQQGPLQQNWGYQYPIAPAQYGGGNYSPMSGQGLNRFTPNLRGQGNFLMPQGLGQIETGGGLRGGMPMPQGMPTNSTWRPMPLSVGGQGYAAPGYPPRIPQLQQPQMQMPMTQGYPSQGFPLQNYPPQGYNQGYGNQKPLQPAWEEPKKGGIKGFISNLMAKRKR